MSLSTWFQINCTLKFPYLRLKNCVDVLVMRLHYLIQLVFIDVVSECEVRPLCLNYGFDVNLHSLLHRYFPEHGYDDIEIKYLLCRNCIEALFQCGFIHIGLCD